MKTLVMIAAALVASPAVACSDESVERAAEMIAKSICEAGGGTWSLTGSCYSRH